MPELDIAVHSQPMSRHNRILSGLKAILSDVVGSDLSDFDPSTNFFDLGLDSLTLIQVSRLIQTEYDVAIPLSQLLDDLSALETLAVYLDQTLPPDAFPPSEPAVPALTETSAAPDVVVLNETEASSTPSNILERVIYQQLKVMSQQLEILRESALNGSKHQLFQASTISELARTVEEAIARATSAQGHSFHLG